MKNLKAYSIVALMIVFALFMCTFPLKWLWNWLMPEIFGLTTITAWQSLGLLLMSVILFRSTGSSSSK